MKTEIKHEGMWWRYIETCDRCGKLTHSHEWRDAAKPDVDEVDFCVDCYKYLLDNRVPYEIAKKQYKHD